MTAPPRQSDATWRPLVSILIAIHLIFVGIALSSNFGGQSSPLARALRGIPLVESYLQLLGMDLSYEFSLASGSPQDAPHYFELSEEGAVGEVIAALPDSSMSHARQRRYRQLAAYAADLDETYAENAEVGLPLPLAICETWTKDLELPTRNYVLRCRRQLPTRLKPKEPHATAKRTTDENVAFELQLVWYPGENRYQAARRQPAQLTSQARPRREPSDATSSADASLETHP